MIPTITPEQLVMTLSEEAAETTRLMATKEMITFSAKQDKIPFTVAWAMIIFTARMEPTLFGETVQMTQSMVEKTRLKEIKEKTPSMVELAMIRSQEEMHHQISFMAGTGMI